MSNSKTQKSKRNLGDDVSYEITIEGLSPLLMHNGRLSNPRDQFAEELKKLSSKRGKTDDDLIEMARTEFFGSAYWNEMLGMFIPMDMINAVLHDGAKVRKLGKEFKAFVDVVPFSDDDAGFSVDFDGPNSLDELWDDDRFVLTKSVRVGTSRVMRTRPMLPRGWRCKFRVDSLFGGVSEEDLRTAIVDAGIKKGIGDWRPRYGRFALVDMKRI